MCIEDPSQACTLGTGGLDIALGKERGRARTRPEHQRPQTTHALVTPDAVADNYTTEFQHPLWLPRGHLHRVSPDPCYDPEKGSGGCRGDKAWQGTCQSWGASPGTPHVGLGQL